MHVVSTFNNRLAEEEILRIDIVLAKYTSYFSEPAPASLLGC